MRTKPTYYLTILLLVLTSTAIQARTTAFEEGYLVLQTGDTIRGLLNWGMENMKFKATRDAQVERFSPSKIKAYVYNSDRIERHNFDNLFYELRMDGPVQFYERTQVSTSYNGQFTQTIIQVTYGVKRPAEHSLTRLRITSTIGYGKGYFKRVAMEYFKDCPEIVADIKNGDYNKPKAIVSMISKYNDWKKRSQS